MSRSSGVAPTGRCGAGEREPARAGGPVGWPLVAGSGGRRPGHVPVPGLVLADLVAGLPGLVVGLGKAVLDSPPRLIIRPASSGLVANGASSAIPAARQRSRSSVQALGRYSSLRPGRRQVPGELGDRHPLFRSDCESGPSRYARARRRDGASANTPATSANVLGRPDLCHRVRQPSEGHFGRPINPA
jgi:hypothetical protein